MIGWTSSTVHVREHGSADRAFPIRGRRSLRVRRNAPATRHSSHPHRYDPGVKEEPAAPQPSRFRRRAAVAVSGTTTVALGIVLLPLPGPGTVVILVGLTILSKEFPSAARALEKARSAVSLRSRRAADPAIDSGDQPGQAP
ncbi:hypothetical protein HQ535_03705 [bacterium]|nr:hypothetical protein [bacterium]